MNKRNYQERVLVPEDKSKVLELLDNVPTVVWVTFKDCIEIAHPHLWTTIGIGICCQPALSCEKFSLSFSRLKLLLQAQKLAHQFIEFCVFCAMFPHKMNFYAIDSQLQSTTMDTFRAKVFPQWIHFISQINVSIATYCTPYLIESSIKFFWKKHLLIWGTEQKIQFLQFL